MILVRYLVASECCQSAKRHVSQPGAMKQNRMAWLLVRKLEGPLACSVFQMSWAALGQADHMFAAVLGWAGLGLG